MDSCSYRAVCRRNYNFRWRICSSIPIACTIQIYESFCTCLDWIYYSIAASTLSILQAVDGIALKRVDSWATAPAGEKVAAFRVAEGIRWTEVGINSIYRILQGTVTIVFGVAITISTVVRRWIGAIGIIAGAVTIAAGVEVAYVGFASYSSIGFGANWYSNIWVGILGAFMWRKAVSKTITV